MGDREEVHGFLLLSGHVTRLIWTFLVDWGVLLLRTLCVLESKPETLDPVVCFMLVPLA